MGQQCECFEQEFAKYCDTKYSLGVGNGLDAIRIILLACGIGNGDEVIIPSNTFIATALAVTQVGAIPVMVEPRPDTFNINPELVEDNITDKTKAIIAVHLYGRTAEMDKLSEIAKRHNLYLFEDACQAHGAIYNGKKAGSLSDAAAFSFYPGKNIGALGDGGAITTDNKDIYEKARRYRNYGSDVKYVHEYPGVNSRLDELQAAFLRAKLKHLDTWNIERKRIARYYNDNINNELLTLPNNLTEENVVHIYPVLTEDRDGLKAYLSDKGITSLSHYPTPIHLQKAYAFLNKPKGSYPIAEYISAHELSIPLYPGLTDGQIDYVVECLNNYKS
jgi:dTDP-4-amino-4,6-dideoxygalactose transaminase